MSNNDYTSLVPKYEFSNIYSEQLEQIKSNALLKRMLDTRKGLSKDPHRPIYHCVNPENTLNDPNGLCFWQGRWHLFYQAYPPEDPRQHWGHAYSEDLIHWKDLPYAIYPNPEECCFSGATLVEENRVIAMYHGTQVGNMVAVSTDPLLLNWDKLTGKEVIPIAKGQKDTKNPYTVFDPCVWKKDGYYFSLSAGTVPGTVEGSKIAADFLFRSKDLENWDYMHPFVENDRFTLAGDDGACPYFWPIGEDKHILIFYSHMSGGQYLIGDYDLEKDKLMATSHGLFNFGASAPSGVHAPSATPDGHGGIVAIFNMNQGLPTNGWNQIMTLPRRISLTKQNHVKVEPAGAIESLRYGHKRMNNITLSANKEIVVDDIKGNALELLVEIDPKDAPMVEINVLRSTNKEEFTRISFFKDRGFNLRTNLNKIRTEPESTPIKPGGATLASGAPTVPPVGTPRKVYPYESILTLDTSYSSILPDALSRPPESAPIQLDQKEPLKLRIFIDRSVVEIFANDQQCLASRVYPGLQDSNGISIKAQGNEAELLSLDAWQMKNIYE